MMKYKSAGFTVNCKCGELAMWCLIDDTGNEIYFCVKCYEKYWK